MGAAEAFPASAHPTSAGLHSSLYRQDSYRKPPQSQSNLFLSSVFPHLRLPVQYPVYFFSAFGCQLCKENFTIRQQCCMQRAWAVWEAANSSFLDGYDKRKSIPRGAGLSSPSSLSPTSQAGFEEICHLHSLGCTLFHGSGK